MYVDEHQNAVMRLWKRGDCGLDRWQEIMSIEGVGSTSGNRNSVPPHCRERIDITIIALNNPSVHAGGGEVTVATDGKEPFPTIASLLERAPSPLRSQVGFLHQVLRIGFVTGQRQREARHRTKMRQRYQLERFTIIHADSELFHHREGLGNRFLDLLITTLAGIHDLPLCIDHDQV